MNTFTQAPEMKKYRRAADAYVDNLIATDASEKTIRNYKICIEQLFDFMAQNKEYAEAGPTYNTIRAWRDDLLTRNAKSSVYQKLKVLKIFFEWASDPGLQENKFYDTNPITKSLFPNMRKERNRPYDMILTDEQVIQLLDNTPPGDGTPYKKSHWARNYAIVVTLLTTELRNSELRALHLCDLDFEFGRIFVEHGKGDKFRVVDFPPIAQTAIKIFLQSGLRPDNLPETAPVFGKLRSMCDIRHPIWEAGRDNWLSQIVRYHVRTVTGVDGVTSHDLRHVGSRIDLNSGMRIEMLQSKLGHASPVVTQIYSGRVMARGGRESAKRVIAAQEEYAQKNREILLAM